MTWRDGRQMYRLVHNPGTGLGVMGHVPLRLVGRGAERTEDVVKTGLVFVKTPPDADGTLRGVARRLLQSVAIQNHVLSCGTRAYSRMSVPPLITQYKGSTASDIAVSRDMNGFQSGQQVGLVGCACLVCRVWSLVVCWARVYRVSRLESDRLLPGGRDRPPAARPGERRLLRARRAAESRDQRRGRVHDQRGPDRPGLRPPDAGPQVPDGRQLRPGLQHARDAAGRRGVRQGEYPCCMLRAGGARPKHVWLRRPTKVSSPGSSPTSGRSRRRTCPRAPAFRRASGARRSRRWPSTRWYVHAFDFVVLEIAGMEGEAKRMEEGGVRLVFSPVPPRHAAQWARERGHELERCQIVFVIGMIFGVVFLWLFYMAGDAYLPQPTASKIERNLDGIADVLADFDKQMHRVGDALTDLDAQLRPFSDALHLQQHGERVAPHPHAGRQDDARARLPGGGRRAQVQGGAARDGGGAALGRAEQERLELELGQH